MGRRMGYRYQRIEIQKEPRERLISDLLLLLLLKIEKFFVVQSEVSTDVRNAPSQFLTIFKGKGEFWETSFFLLHYFEPQIFRLALYTRALKQNFGNSNFR